MDTVHTSTAFTKAENRVNREDNSLPKAYGRTEAFLLPKDPGWMYLFWEITPSTCDYIRQQNGYDIFERGRAVVRLHDVTGVNFDGHNSRGRWDVPVMLSADSWYLQVPQSGANYIAELGLLTPEGKFILIARSNATATPPGRVSDILDERWMIVEGDFQKLLSMSGARYIGLGASERLQVMQESWKTILGPLGAPSSYQSSNMSSKNFLGGKEETDDMWLRVNAEIIVYGQASPGAKVFINGKEIELKDGAFSIRQALNKGDVLDLPIKATKNKMVRKAKFHAGREE